MLQSIRIIEDKLDARDVNDYLLRGWKVVLVVSNGDSYLVVMEKVG